VAGAIGIGDSVGVAAGADVLVITQTTDAHIGKSSDVQMGGAIGIGASDTQNITTIVGNAAGGGDVGVAGSVDVVVLNSDVKAYVEGGAGLATSVEAGGNFTVASDGGCFNPTDNANGFTITTDGGGLSTSGSPIIRLTDYASQMVGAAGAQTHVHVNGTMPPSGQLYITIHMDQGLKQTGGWTRGTDDAGVRMNGSGGILTTLSNIPPQQYVFSTSGTSSNTQTPTSINDWKKNPGVAGLAQTKNTTTLDVFPIVGAAIELKDPAGVSVGTATTDADGFYFITYKSTGKAADYKIYITSPALTTSQTVTLKANAFVISNFLKLIP